MSDPPDGRAQSAGELETLDNGGEISATVRVLPIDGRGEVTGVTVSAMSVSVAEVAMWGQWLLAVGKAADTIDLRTYHVRRALTEIQKDPYAISTDDLIDWLASKTWKPNTRRAYRVSLRVFFEWIHTTGRRPDNPAAAIPSIKLPRSLPRPTPEAAYRQGLRDGTERVRRMVTLAAGYGLRRGEIARTRREDVLEGVGDASNYVLRVVGKGGHVRLVPITDDFARDLLAQPHGWLFPSSSTRDGRAGTHLTPAHVGKLVSHALPDAWTCHTLRHRCGTVAYALGGRDLRAVQELLGHAKPETTALYTEVGTDAVRKAAVAAAA